MAVAPLEAISYTSMETAYNAAMRAMVKHTDTFDSLRELVEIVVDAAVEKLAISPREVRSKFLTALIAQARMEAAQGRGAEKGMYDSEISRVADWLETLL